MPARGAMVRTQVTFHINEKKYTVNGTTAKETTLNEFLRGVAQLTGTKFQCMEGGCGVCVVSATANGKTFAVNSCLVPVFSCDGWSVTTVEGLGGHHTGYHPIQKALSTHHGTQCGFCSPGMVMNMYALSKDQPVDMKEVENAFGGNLCRCTGYRTILDAFKSLASDAPEELKRKNVDIEDLWKVCPKSGKPCSGKCSSKPTETLSSPVHVYSENSLWVKVTSLEQIFEAFAEARDKTYMLVGGNTAHGVYRRTTSPQLFIDVTAVSSLTGHTLSPALTLGGNMSLTAAMTLFHDLAKTQVEYKYLSTLAEHIDLIANVPIRNTGTLAGNLTMKHERREFPSDVFLFFEAVNAKVTVVDKTLKPQTMTLMEYLDLDMKQKVITAITLPKLPGYKIGTYKIMPRAQNAHAYVNAGFLAKVDESGVVLERPNVVFGGIEPEFLHAKETENWLMGKSLYEESTLHGALMKLEAELNPDYVLPDASVKYRKSLAQALFYKFVLSVVPGLHPSLTTGGSLLSRPVSSGVQDYETDPKVWPLNKGVPKLESLAQVSGEAKYVDDLPVQPGELHAALVLSPVSQGTIRSIDPSEALKMDGVVAFFDAKDIPGDNNFAPKLLTLEEPEEFLCSKEVLYAGQPVGIIVAESHRQAAAAADVVKVDVEQRPGIHVLREAIPDPDRMFHQQEKVATDKEARSNAVLVLNGNFSIGGQFHNTMETQCCVVVPNEDCLDVYPSSQWMDMVHCGIAGALNINESRINVHIKRVGGAFGSRIARAGMISTSCALAAFKLNRPVRLVTTLETNMAAIGKRNDFVFNYTVGVNESGKIQHMETKLYQNSGSSQNETAVHISLHHMVNCYDDSTWDVVARAIKTDTASNTMCRAPGSCEGVGFIEHVMEHIAKVTGLDPIDVRTANMPADDGTLSEIVTEHKAVNQYQARRAAVDEFNKANRWRKRGLSLVPMRYPFSFWGHYHALVSIYAKDGSVAVTHGGIEMGQGVNTKVAQVVAHVLGIDLELVSIKASSSLTAPNGMVSGGGMASEACTYAAMMCCKELLQRLEPIKAQLTKPTWPEITQAAYDKEVNLCATYMFTTKDNVKNYNVWGATIGEVEIDILTGQHQVLRVDLVEDVGKSISPEVDLGQIEGAFIMGLGYWTSELLVHDPDTGALLTNRTWNYKPPGVKDIPVDFRVQMLRNSDNPTGVMRSKNTAEPAFCMSVVIMLAIRNALDSARKDAGAFEEWYTMNAPATTENIFLTGLTNFTQFTLKKSAASEP